MRRAAILLLVSGVLATSGCCGAWVHRPFGPGTLCNPTNGCDAPSGPACGDSCGDDPCGAPNGNPRGGPLGYYHPLLAAILHPFQWGGCGGCGELYLGDFHGDPPDCSDPCDSCGNWTGGDWMGPAPVIGYGGGGTPGPTPCPSCGVVHTANRGTQDYVSSPSPPVISQAEHVVVAGTARR